MPELPEVESARATIERGGLDRPIAAVDDSDTYECRPHAPGDLHAALVGRRLTKALRRGKSIWCETSAVNRRTGSGPTLGIHLGMSGRILITDRDGNSTEGGDRLTGGYAKITDQPNRKPEWDRFTITFADGGQLRLFDKRRLGRVRLDPDLDALGPDAQLIKLAELRDQLGHSRVPIKARLLDQSVVAGIGNLLADQTLWRAELAPTRPTDTLASDEVARLHRALGRELRAAIKHGGVHTGALIEHRRAGGRCPACGTELRRATVGSRTTWWCPQHQR